MSSKDRRSFLVAGGSSGLGAACVRRLAAAGDGVVIADVKPPEASWPRELDDRCFFSAADVTDAKAIGAALATARQRFGPLRGVVVSAGIVHAERILGREGPAGLEAFWRVIEVDLLGTFNVLRLAAAAMQENEPDADGQRGAIVTTSSTAAFEGQIGQAAYAAAKGGVASLTLPAARELGGWGIRVVSIAPGVFETPMMRPVAEDRRQALESQTPFPCRFGRPDEFAALVEHIFANPMLNGAVLRLDGGLRMPAR
jgi:NAD(P)-dependent dehydrogenase (short-subunit alcohol dehydrogenase family)